MELLIDPSNLGEMMATASDLAHMADSQTWLDIAVNLTCDEAELVTAFLRAWNGIDFAATFLAAHAEGDEYGDAHANICPDDPDGVHHVGCGCYEVES